MLTGDKNTFPKQRDSVVEIIRRLRMQPGNPDTYNKVGFIDHERLFPLTTDKTYILRNLQKSKPISDPDIKNQFERSVKFFTQQNGGRSSVPKVLFAFIDDLILNYDANSIVSSLKRLLDQGVKVVLLQSGSSYSLQILPTFIKDRLDRVDVDIDDLSDILEKILSQLNKGNNFVFVLMWFISLWLIVYTNSVHDNKNLLLTKISIYKTVTSRHLKNH